MKTLVCLAIAIVLLANGTSAQKTRTTSALSEMVATERAFAKTSEEKGTRDAFMMFIAEDGILFRPGPVMGKRWMQEHPVAASDKRPLLAWQPIFAEMSAAGDLGYTFGPWEFKSDIKDEKAAAYGHFATIWKKQTDGTWKFAIDLRHLASGFRHPCHSMATEEVSNSKKVNIPSVDVASTRGVARQVVIASFQKLRKQRAQ